MKLRTLVVPVAGRGKRLWPLTLTRPKALVEINDKYLLDYVIEEGLEAGFDRVVVVVGPDQYAEIEKVVDKWRKTIEDAEFFIVEQDKPMGTGDALWRAAEVVGGEPCAMRYPDDLLTGSPSALKLLKDVYEKEGKPELLVQEVSWEKAASCGVVESAKEIYSGVYSFSGIQEQIKNKSAMIDSARKPVSNLAVIGAYVFPGDVFEYLARQRVSVGAEDDSLPINIVFPALMDKYGFLAVKFPGKRFDCGSLDGLAQAQEYLKNN